MACRKPRQIASPAWFRAAAEIGRIDAGPGARATGSGTIDLEKLGFEKKGERSLLAERILAPENRIQPIHDRLDGLVELN